jgi:hypothetical protein
LALAALQVAFSILVHIGASMRYVSERTPGSISTAIEQQTPSAQAGSTTLRRFISFTTNMLGMTNHVLLS